ncbi:MAG: hydrogenase maturation nickel metallochaperone HypA [Candidatus Omnitrophota bacterium]
MHDMWFASKIVVYLKEKISGITMPKHVTISVTLGLFTHVSAESLRAAFQVLMGKEDSKNVTLNIKKNQAVIQCKKCGTVTKISEAFSACPVCQSEDFDINDGEEFLIESIEIDNDR